jgi:hypothetical protein
MQTLGVPGKVTQEYLQSVGFKSKNDRYLLPILKALKFLDPGGIPTDRWRAYRDKQKAKGVLAAAITETYSGLFETYPDAYRRDNEALRNYFSTHSGSLNESTLQLVVRTFKVLCGEADFESAAAGEEVLEREEVKDQSTSKRVRRESVEGGGLTININIQLQLPATDDASVYEKLFEAMNKTILARGRPD